MANSWIFNHDSSVIHGSPCHESFHDHSMGHHAGNGQIQSKLDKNSKEKQRTLDKISPKSSTIKDAFS